MIIEIKKLLQENGFDLNNFVISKSRKPVTNRFEFTASGKEEVVNKTAIFAIKYFTYEKIVILWRVKGIEKYREVDRSKFSVDRDDVFRNFAKGFTVKDVEFKGIGAEEVWFFPADKLDELIIKIKELLK